MSETQDVIEVMARCLDRPHVYGAPTRAQRAERLLFELQSAGYRLAGPGECVVDRHELESISANAASLALTVNSIETAADAMLSASQQKGTKKPAETDPAG